MKRDEHEVYHTLYIILKETKIHGKFRLNKAGEGWIIAIVNREIYQECHSSQKYGSMCLKVWSWGS